MSGGLKLLSAALLAAIMAVGPSVEARAGVLYGADGSAGNPSNLYILDPATGGVISNAGLIGFAVTGLAVDPTTGILYGATSASIRSLITIDKATGAGALVGGFVLDRRSATIADIAFDPSGKL